MAKEYIKLTEDRYLLKNSNSIIVSEKEMKEKKYGDNKLNVKPEAKSPNKSDKVAE